MVMMSFKKQIFTFIGSVDILEFGILTVRYLRKAPVKLTIKDAELPVPAPKVKSLSTETHIPSIGTLFAIKIPTYK